MTLMIMTIITVPKMAGNTPPSVLASRGSSETNSQTRGSGPHPRLLVIDRADVALLAAPDLPPHRLGLGAPRPDHRPARRGARRHDLPRVAHLLDRPDEEAPLGALDHRDVGGVVALD